MEIKIVTQQCADQLGHARRFHYYLMVEVIESDSLCCESYGVHIDEEDGDVCDIPRITTSAARIDELISLLVEHKVGPAGLSDVVADWL